MNKEKIEELLCDLSEREADMMISLRRHHDQLTPFIISVTESQIRAIEDIITIFKLQFTDLLGYYPSHHHRKDY